MSTLNIGGSADDESYRYKMPKLLTKIEGRGNGIKTVIPNMSDIAKSLKCPASYPTKFFGVELGAQSNYDAGTDKAVVNGAHNAKDLQALLTKFIDIFILCPKCKLPEITMKVKKDAVKIDCAACGHNGKLETVHRLITFILKHPPPVTKKSSSKAAGGVAKVAGKASSKAKSKGAATEEEVVWFTDTSKEATEKRKAEEMASFGGEKDLRDRVEAIMSGGADEAPKEATIADSLRIFSKEAKSDAEIVGEIRRLGLANGMSQEEQLYLMIDGLLPLAGGKSKSVISSLKSYAVVFKAFADTTSNARALWDAFEKMIGVSYPGMLSAVPLILQALYENDVLEEEVILDWFEHPESSFMVSKSVAEQVREKATPFVDWLKNAEEDEEDDEE